MDGTGQLQPQHYQALNEEGKSPLDFAQERQSDDKQAIVDFIVAHGKKPFFEKEKFPKAFPDMVAVYCG